MPETKIKSLNQHDFAWSLLKVSGKFYANDENAQLSELRIYQKSVFSIWQDISTLFNMLKLSYLFIKKSRYKKYQIENIYTSDLLQYHLDCYFMRVTSMGDLIHKLINRVYELGYKEDLGLYKKLNNHSEEIEDIKFHLGALDIMFNELKKLRNNVAHGGNISDSSLGMLSAGELAIEGSIESIMTPKEYNARLTNACDVYSYYILKMNGMIYAFLMGHALDKLYVERLKREENKEK